MINDELLEGDIQEAVQECMLMGHDLGPSLTFRPGGPEEILPRSPSDSEEERQDFDEGGGGSGSPNIQPLSLNNRDVVVEQPLSLY